MQIRPDDLSGPEIVALLEEHMAGMRSLSPPESVHAFPLARLRSADVWFWSGWENGELLGCGALKELDAQHGEIKSMRTSARHLRKGVGRAMLEHIIREARRRGYRRLSLETGAQAGFRAGAAALRRRGVYLLRGVRRLHRGSAQRVHDEGALRIGLPSPW
jgi:putative acetyltransferase